MLLRFSYLILRQLFRLSSRMSQKTVDPHQGQEQILPAVLEFPELHQDIFLRQVITELDVNAPSFKLAPVYTLYLCARYVDRKKFKTKINKIRL